MLTNKSTHDTISLKRGRASRKSSENTVPLRRGRAYQKTTHDTAPFRRVRVYQKSAHNTVCPFKESSFLPKINPRNCLSLEGEIMFTKKTPHDTNTLRRGRAEQKINSRYYPFNERSCLLKSLHGTVPLNKM